MSRAADRTRDDSGETLAFLVLWPTLIVAILVLLVHTFIVVNAQAEAEVAASAGLRAAWRAASDSDFHTELGLKARYNGVDPRPSVVGMANAAKDAAAEAAGQGEGWRWWTPGSTEVRSDWCNDPSGRVGRPDLGQAGWVQVKVEGEVFGPMAALWPGRLDRVYAVAAGPAVLDQHIGKPGGSVLPDQGDLTMC